MNYFRKENPVKQRITKKIFIILFVSIVSICLSCIAYAFSTSELKANQKEIPALDKMYVIESKKLEEPPNEHGIILRKNLTGKLRFEDELGLHLLKSEMNNNNPYVIEKIQSDNEDYVILTYYNYILGDTSKYRYDEESGNYNYESGIDYKTPLSLEVAVMLSEEQMKTGWNSEFLGAYSLEETYISKQGYKVHIIKNTSNTIDSEQVISNRFAVFVADGVRYTLKGKTTVENIKEVIDSMKY